MSRSVEIQVWADVPLADIDTETLLDELEARKKAPDSLKTDYELLIIKQRFFEQRRRAATQNPASVTFEEREFWHHVHDLDL
jgi:hypothetical protein